MPLGKSEKKTSPASFVSAVNLFSVDSWRRVTFVWPTPAPEGSTNTIERLFFAGWICVSEEFACCGKGFAKAGLTLTSAAITAAAA